ncbi:MULTISPECIES: urea ABC transporter ATP-binding protein UrtD [unclassified Lentimonas]|uniref:urea ABC transporter ATP-binding protein UrtD n=1 Tax=unclassified Lentimonas TaxID=2630993 RepID=UPI0013277F89|nr:MULTISPECIES: urea ABC transporter ATP-binding protein UrtD [unclassified Lentimonas]CAA6678961.1 Urea ABC transporter, ATPase protein UrtD [Lentimonas sp. CC4]CAA6685114.1 Urea ABC transporter, ATPase protein UrtD [Lentimonas sp. CC6]CAA6696925.1 Urea ABC transporter, ATPase protein UrtD [Lentimonas sp. CC19]CAA6697509.1 Urea ABC transporter, ATPase protein UrtD [Lentimonas sp. CC10]CAA7071133.1 Urea ABC transporter, ATPase protein UrtD [Lentimonas sp. CC11]
MPSDTDFLLAIEDLTVSFDGFKAVDDLTLYIDKGELRVIIGPNGAGKTTVLDLISGKTKSSSGSIRYNNIEMTGLREHEIVRAGIGRKFQTPSIYEKLSVFENLEISYPWGRTVWGSLRFSRNAKVVERIFEVAEEIFLSDVLDQPAELLSHGQKQWLEIGMLLVQDPELVMLDEPVAGMTAKERDATAILLRKIAKERSIIIIEHDMDFVAKIADRVTVLHLGKIIKEGTMEEVRDDPRVKEVYLGH